MAQTQFASPLINQTVDAFNGDVTAVSPLDGLSLINNWISALHTDTEPSNPVVANLNELTLQLRSGTPDVEQIQSLLHTLAEQTRQAGQSVDEAGQRASLNELASAIGSFGEQLAGQRGPAKTGGNATAGPTVGGISSH